MKYCADCEEPLSEDDEFYCECSEEPLCFQCYDVHQERHGNGEQLIRRRGEGMFKIGDKVISIKFGEGIVINPSETACGYDLEFPTVVRFNDNWIQYYTSNGTYPAGVIFPDGDKIELVKSR